MAGPTRTPRRLRRLADILVVATLVAACGAGSTPSPSPSPTPTAAPTPTPFDVGKAFLAIVNEPSFSARMDLEGTMEMGVTATLSGTITGAGADSQTLMRIGVAGTTIETESITTGGKTYSRNGDGPWLEQPAKPAAENTSMTDWLTSLASIKDLGIETKNGRALHHLSAGDEPVPPAVLGLDPSTFTDPVVTIDFFTEDDGTPAVFAVVGTWLQLVNGQNIKVDFNMDMTLSGIGAPITIRPPSDVWTMAESPLGYSLAHPAGFKVENRDGYDAIVKGGIDWVYVQRWPDAAGLNAEGFRDAILELVKPDWGDPITAPVATKLGGEPGYMATFDYTYEDGTEEIAFDTMAMHANVGWDVTFFSLPGEETADLALFQQYLATFAYTD